MNCYQCDKAVKYLFPDSRCGACTRLTPEEVQGVAQAPASEAQEAQEELDRKALAWAFDLARMSLDPSTKVGAVVLRADGTFAAGGWNKFLPGMSNAPELWADREYKYKHVIHAEAVALAQVSDQEARGGTLYTSFPCCPNCMEQIGRRGLRRVVLPPLPTEGKTAAWVEQWRGWMADAFLVADKYGIRLAIRHHV